MASSWSQTNWCRRKCYHVKQEITVFFRTVSKTRFPEARCEQQTLNSALFFQGTSRFVGYGTIWTPLVDFVLKCKACSGLPFFFLRGEGRLSSCKLVSFCWKTSGNSSMKCRFTIRNAARLTVLAAYVGLFPQCGIFFKCSIRMPKLQQGLGPPLGW